ncbi:EXOC5 [Mytilus edulis]|uniref:Exocyst complex component 5 n=1 Tax=Mytilus edulis TaxID=6550 RepID=A0A8S3VFS1_MYTED|nr:EXOC5 [Mytilus edulis]
MSHQVSLEELEQEPFDAHEFVERIAWRTIHNRDQAQFNPMLLHTAFEKMIKDLEGKNAQIEKKIEKLEENCKDEEKRHWHRVAELQKKNQSTYSHFQVLDEKINLVATKVVHLGDQLEGVNNPRAKAVEAKTFSSVPVTTSYSNTPPSSNTSTTSQQTGESRSGTLIGSDTIKKSDEFNIPPPLPPRANPPINPPVLEDEQTRGQQSAPPSLAGSRDSLNDAARAGTPDHLKRYSADSTLMKCDISREITNSSSGSSGNSYKGRGHRRVGSDEGYQIKSTSPVFINTAHIPVSSGQTFHQVSTFPGSITGNRANALPQRSVSHQPQTSERVPATGSRHASWTSDSGGGIQIELIPPRNTQSSDIQQGTGLSNAEAFAMNLVYHSLDQQLQPITPYPQVRNQWRYTNSIVSELTFTLETPFSGYERNTALLTLSNVQSLISGKAVAKIGKHKTQLNGKIDTSTGLKIELCIKTPLTEDFEVIINGNGGLHAFRYESSVSYGKEKIRGEVNHDWSSEAIKGNMLLSTPILEDIKIEYDVNGNPNSFGTTVKASIGKLNGIEEITTVRLGVKSIDFVTALKTTLSGNVKSSQLRFLHDGYISSFKTNIEATHADKTIKADASFKHLPSIEGSLSLQTPFEKLRDVNIKIEHTGSVKSFWRNRKSSICTRQKD